MSPGTKVAPAADEVAILQMIEWSDSTLRQAGRAYSFPLSLFLRIAFLPVMMSTYDKESKRRELFFKNPSLLRLRPRLVVSSSNNSS